MAYSEFHELTGQTMQVIDQDAPTLLNFYDTNSTATGVPHWYFPGLASEYAFTWAPVITEIGSDKRHLGFDPRGIGGSTGSPESVSQIADDAARVLDAKGVEAVHMIGHSLGGVMAVAFANQHPDRTKSLTVISSPLELDAERQEQAQKHLKLLESERGRKLLQRVAQYAFSSAFRESEPGIVEANTTMLARQNAEVYTAYCLAGLKADLGVTYEGPKLFVGSDKDETVKSDSLQRVAHSVGGLFIEVPDAGHNPPLEQPKAIAHTIQAFSSVTEHLYAEDRHLIR